MAKRSARGEIEDIAGREICGDKSAAAVFD